MTICALSGAVFTVTRRQVVRGSMLQRQRIDISVRQRMKTSINQHSGWVAGSVQIAAAILVYLANEGGNIEAGSRCGEGARKWMLGRM